MYIVPTGQLKILRNVPVDADYQNTIYFGNGENARQASVFAGYAKFTFDDHSYQRVTVNKIRVGVNAERLYDCNYLMFQNSVGFGSYMWFYAFIDSVTYINNSVSEIEYTIDSLQTYLTYIDFNMCFIDRQHTPTDNVGDNIVPEGLELGEQVFNNYGFGSDFHDSNNDVPWSVTGGIYLSVQTPPTNVDMCVVVSMVDTSSSSANLVDGVFSGTKLVAYPCTPNGINNLVTLVTQHYQDPDTIQAMYMCPRRAVSSSLLPDSGYIVPYGSKGFHSTFSGTPIAGNETLDGYLPINKKMYTYPYNYLHVDNANGSSLALRYEYFTKVNNVRTPKVAIGCNLTYPLQVILNPIDYKGSADVLQTETLTINGYPMCSWNVDTFKAWVSQNAVPIIIQAAGGALQSAVRGRILQPNLQNYMPMRQEETFLGRTGAVKSLIGSVTGALSEGYSAAIASDMVKGNFTNKGANFALGQMHFHFGRVSVQHEYAKMLDDYFSRYGYAIKKLQVPNLNARPEFTYIKTIGCTINGSVPADDERNICNIMDNGITFWNNPANVGQYGLNNVPV